MFMVNFATRKGTFETRFLTFPAFMVDCNVNCKYNACRLNLRLKEVQRGRFHSNRFQEENVKKKKLEKMKIFPKV